MIFNINLLSRLIWDSFLLPVDALVYIHHLGIWLVSWSPTPRWAVTEGMKKTDTSISQWSCQNHEGICKGREQERVFSSSMSRSLLCFLISNRIHCPAVLLSLCERKWVREWVVCVCVYKSVSVCFFCCWKWIHVRVCVHFVCFAMLLCVFLERCVCETGIPQRRTVKIILKFSACVESQGISPSLLMQVLSGFLLKRCLGIRNGRGAFPYSLLCTP